MSKVLPYDQWVESDEAAGLGELDKIKGYGDHYRTNSFASGTYNEQEAGEVETKLFSLAANRGLLELDPEDPDKSIRDFQTTGRKNPIEDVDLAIDQLQFEEASDEDITGLRRFRAALELPDTDSGVLDEYAAKNNKFLSPSNLNKARRRRAATGVSPFYIDQDENGALDIVIDPSLEKSGSELTNEEIVQLTKQDPYFNTRYLPLVKKSLEKPEGFTISRNRARLIHEAKGVIASEEGDIADSYRRDVIQKIRNGDVEEAEDIARNMYSDRRVVKELYDEDTFVKAFMDFGRSSAGLGTPQVLSTG